MYVGKNNFLSYVLFKFLSTYLHFVRSPPNQQLLRLRTCFLSKISDNFLRIVEILTFQITYGTLLRGRRNRI